MTNKAPPRKPKKSLRALAIILLFSGIVRIFDQNIFANAQDAETEVRADFNAEKTILSIPFSKDTIKILLETFKERESRLLEREAEIETNAQTLEIAEARVKAKVDELTEIEALLANTLALADKAAEDDLARLTSVYENMKPQSTAELFAKMTPGFAAGFLGLMQPAAAAAVMTELEPNIAHNISVMLAGRNANAFDNQ
jgi:flagellar motility protein MotE (MotC chaperone)